MVLGARRTDRLETIADELRSDGAEVVTAGVDVTRRADLDQLVQNAIVRFGRLDVLVSNAGISTLGPMESLRQESTDGVIRTTSVSPGFVRTELGDSIDDPDARAWVRSNMNAFGLDPDSVARAIAFAIEQPRDVEIGEIVIRPTVQD